MRFNEAYEQAKAMGRDVILAGAEYTIEELDAGDIELTAVQFLSNDWSVSEPADITITEDDLSEAWNVVRAGFTSVKSAEQSALFKALKSQLFG